MTKEPGESGRVRRGSIGWLLAKANGERSYFVKFCLSGWMQLWTLAMDHDDGIGES